MTICGIVENLLSDFLFLLITIGISWLLLTCSRRAKLLKFFGVNESRRIVIYLSNLRVKPGGAVGIDGQLRNYQGSAAGFGEMFEANRFRDLFNYLLPSLSENPGMLSKLLISDVQVQLLHSPLKQEQIERSSSFITLGSPAYNLASEFAETKLQSDARFRLGKVDLGNQRYLPLDTSPYSPDADANAAGTADIYTGATGSAVTPPFELSTSGSPAWISEQPPGLIHKASRGVAPSITATRQTDQQPPAILVDGIPDMTDTIYGFVERLIDHESNRCIFYVAGISELATAGAANYLISEWEKLCRKYGNEKKFLVMLRFEPGDHRRWSIVFEK